MQFTIIALDGNDSEAAARRAAARPAHIAQFAKLHATGEMLFGGAILDDNGTMIGSNIIADFPDRAACDAWLATDPYTTGGVWQQVTIYPFKAVK